MSETNVPVDIITGYFGGESFQAIDCTGTDNQMQGNKTLDKEKQKQYASYMDWQR